MRTSLRSRFVAALAAGGALAGVTLACGGAVDGIEDGPSGTPGGSGTATAPSGTTVNNSPSGTSQAPPPPTLDASKKDATKDVATDTTGLCQWGQPQQTCYTHEQLESMAKNPPRGGDVGDDSGPLPWDKDGCLPALRVQDGCCNTAVSGPAFDGAKCCYVHCTGACCGRPFIVEGEARVARVVGREDWSSLSMRAVDRSLDTRFRERIAKAWANDAAMEHASVAAFARFTLDLLALGAPADILLAAQDAARDEVEHARACFSIASVYAGRTLGPSPLDVSGACALRSLAEIAAATATEGCVGEAISSALASARAARCTDDATRSVLERIAEEEARHAELAWRFVGWAIAIGGADVRDAVAQAFASARRAPPVAYDAALHGVPAETLRAHGLLDERTARAIVAHSLRDDVTPCAAAIAA